MARRADSPTSEPKRRELCPRRQAQLRDIANVQPSDAVEMGIAEDVRREDDRWTIAKFEVRDLSFVEACAAKSGLTGRSS